MNLSLNTCVTDRDGLVEVRGLVQKFTVVGFMGGEVGVICEYHRDPLEKTRGRGTRRTFKHSDHAKKYIVFQNVFVHRMVVQHY